MVVHLRPKQTCQKLTQSLKFERIDVHAQKLVIMTAVLRQVVKKNDLTQDKDRSGAELRTVLSGRVTFSEANAGAYARAAQLCGRNAHVLAQKLVIMTALESYRINDTPKKPQSQGRRFANATSPQVCRDYSNPSETRNTC